MYSTVVEIAKRFRVSRDAVYAWIRIGTIPSSCVDRVGSTIRIRQEEFDQLLREGKLLKRRQRPVGPRLAEDSVTTRRTGLQFDHRWVSESGNVLDGHPYRTRIEASIDTLESKL
jgi:excisionase family DNA binding protein